jgi:hypothetical protein
MPPARPRVLLNQMNQIIAALVGVDTLPDEFCDGPPLREVDAEQWAHTSLVDRVVCSVVACGIAPTPFLSRRGTKYACSPMNLTSIRLPAVPTLLSPAGCGSS